MSHEDEATLNIGALSMATGVPVETIRTWERRYGFPESQRNDAGHRIYDLDTIQHLRLITSILSKGYRPSQLEGRSREELQELLEKTTQHEQQDLAESPHGSSRPDEQDTQRWCDRWMEAVAELDREGFVGALGQEFNRMKAVEFVQRRIRSFFVEIGDGWASERIGVVHEHFASECVRDFLANRWRPMNKSAGGPTMVLATFPGEQHCLGLHTAALVATMARWQVVFLGANTPVEDIATAAAHTDAAAVASSVSEYANSAATVNFLAKLRELVDPSVDIIIGGRGRPDEVAGVEVLDELQQLYERLDRT